jgi:CHAT domain-containing protein/Tfp pilus assembly protein PilF
MSRWFFFKLLAIVFVMALHTVSVMMCAASELDGQQRMNIIKKAMKYYEEAGAEASKSKTNKDFKRVSRKFEKAKDLFEEADVPEGVYRVLTNLGVVYSHMGKYDDARKSLESALNTARSMSKEKDEALILNNLGTLYTTLAEYDRSIEVLKLSLSIREKHHDYRGVVDSLINLSNAFSDQGRISEAEPILQRAVKLSKKIGDPSVQSIVLNNLGKLYRDYGQFAKARSSLEDSLKLKKEVNDKRGEGIVMQNLGALHADRGAYSKALELLEKSIVIHKETGDLKGQEEILLLQGEIEEHKKQFEPALKSYLKAFEIIKKLGLPNRQVNEHLGNYFLELGELEKAKQPVFDSGDKVLQGRYYLAQSKPLKAESYFKDYLVEAEKGGQAEALFAAWMGLGRVFEALEDYESAKDYYLRAFKITEDMRASLLPRERKTFFDVKVKGFFRSEPAKGLTRVRMKLNEALKSIESSEVTRARAFSDKIAERSSEVSRDVPRQVIEKEHELCTKLAALLKLRNQTDREKQSKRYEMLSRQIEDAKKVVNDFISMLKRDYPAYAAVKYPEPVKLRDSAIRDDEYVIVYDVVGDGLGVKLIKGKKILSTFYLNWEIKELDSLVRTFRAPFESAELRKFDPKLGKRLYGRLMAPILAAIPEGSSVVIIPDGILGILPFECLVMSGEPEWKNDKLGTYPDGLTYVGEKYRISYYQSITALTLVRKLAKDGNYKKKLLVLADPIFDIDDPRIDQIAANKKEAVEDLPERFMSIETETGLKFGRLPRTGDLAENLGDIFKKQAELLTGIDASKPQLLKKNLSLYKYIVFATHGYYGNNLPGIKEPVLVLTMLNAQKQNDGFLKMSEVTGLKLKADMVALTACQSGLGRHAEGEGVMGMGRAFQYAGAQSVLMSLWSVSERSSVKLVEYFIDGLGSGDSKVEAVYKARERLKNEGFKHPFYWASFILVGES